MTSVSYGPEVCRDLGAALKREWKEKNNAGASASSTILGTNTKPSHGLLSVLSGSGDQIVLLSGLDEILFVGDRPYPLSTHQFFNTAYPKGYLNLEYFYRMPFPTWIYRAEGLALVKMVILVHGEQTVLIRYQFLSSYGDFVRLQVRPIFAFRKSKDLIYETPERIPEMKTSQGAIELNPGHGLPKAHIMHNAGVVDREGFWFKRLSYHKLKREEDLYAPCSLLYAFLKEDGVYLSVSTRFSHDFDPFLIGVKEKNLRKSG